jgi:hypothetical protein
VVFDEFQSMQLRQFDQALGENRHRFIAEIYSKCSPPKDQQQDDADDPFREQRTKALWDGLRRVYFHEVEPEPNEEVIDGSRRPPPRVHDDLSLPFCIERGPRDDPDDAPSGLGFTITDRTPDIDNDSDGFEPPAHEDTESSNGEDIGKPSTETMLEEDVNGQQPNGEPMTGEPSWKTLRRHFVSGRLPNGEPMNGEKITQFDAAKAYLGESKRMWNNVGRKIFLSVKTIRRILACKETIHKYGVFVPRNDREADSSPEAKRWASGRQLEWIRLQEQGTFERNWDWPRLRKAYPDYQKRDVGHVFYVYDHKHSGEHRVRLVFDGSRQNPETYTDTYAPTARGESVRLFHLYAVEETWEIAQFDVPQAFLKSPIDCILFVYPPKGFDEFPGQLLRLRLSLYGAKQSAALWNKMIDTFLQKLGFSPSPMDPCLYRRKDSIIILFCDDLRVAGLQDTVMEIKAALYKEFQITTSDGTRFLGMDTYYNMELGYLKLHMQTYIESTHERFKGFDLTRGVPFREIVGCLLWICLCVMGPELLRVKDLARRSNSYVEEDYKDAVKVLERIYERRMHGIIFLRGGAGKEIVPSNSRNGISISQPALKNDNNGNTAEFNELRESSLYKVKDVIADEDIRPVTLPLNEKYQLTIYADASFAVGPTKQSVSGYLVYLNGTPLLWGSLKQTIVVDSSCSAEYVAASIACKQVIHAENIIGFLGFSCAKPYSMYTDSSVSDTEYLSTSIPYITIIF